jgi:serine/threonine protein kinase
LPLASDTLLGPYRIRRLIGAGGMGEVYEAIDVRLDRKNDRLLVAPSFSVRGDLTVLVNWQSRLTN